ncbi:MAG: hypothetical protein K2M95_06025 [Clostridiales bacterium]|nr:hypothetical protein [Clostridiales bacterium]
MKFTQALLKVSRAQIEQMCGEDFAARAASILSLLFPALGALSSVTEEAYASFDGDPAPLVKVDEGTFFLELWHGPSLGYEDIPFAVRSCLPAQSDEGALLAIAPLIACYVSAYVDLLDAGEIDYGDEVNFCVGYGDGSLLTAGQCASEMGLPVGKLICALKEDENADFLGMGIPRGKIVVFRTDEEEIVNTIGYAFDEYGYVLDPHTAAAVYAMEEYTESTDDERVTVVLSTASPHLFASEVLTAIGEQSTGSFRRDLKLLEEVTALDAPESLIKLSEKAKLFTGTMKAEELSEALRALASKTEK